MGFIKGLTKQAFAVLGIILGIILGTLFYKPFADFLRETMNMPDRPASIMAFFIILLVVPLICGVLGNLLSKLIHVASLGFIDRILGAAFGLLKYLLIMGLVIMLLDMTGLSENTLTTKIAYARDIRFFLEFALNYYPYFADKSIKDISFEDLGQISTEDITRL